MPMALQAAHNVQCCAYMSLPDAQQCVSPSPSHGALPAALGAGGIIPGAAAGAGGERTLKLSGRALQHTQLPTSNMCKAAASVGEAGRPRLELQAQPSGHDNLQVTSSLHIRPFSGTPYTACVSKPTQS